MGRRFTRIVRLFVLAAFLLCALVSGRHVPDGRLAPSDWWLWMSMALLGCIIVVELRSRE